MASQKQSPYLLTPHSTTILSLLRPFAPLRPSRPLRRGAHELEARALEVSRQVVPDQRAVDMERACARGQEEGAHDLADPHAHEPRGVERDAAALCR